MLFISYAREDWQAATALVTELDAEGIDCVIDPDLTEGDPFWRGAIAQRFPKCLLMLGLASAHAERSPWVEQEQRAFPGPKLWIAVDHAAVYPASFPGASGEPVQTNRAVRAIRAVLPAGLGRLTSRREQPDRLIRPGERLQQIQEQRRRLEAFVRSRNHRPVPTLDIAGDNARISNGSVELQLRAIHAGTRGRAIFVGTEPVTNAQYGLFIEDTGYEEPPTWRHAAFRADNVPVTGVNWFEACAFAAWVGGDLPSESEWIAAASDGARRFATSSGRIDPGVACYGRPFGRSAPVAARTYCPNPDGFYGLCGNTWDWCSSPWGPHRVIRGGGCMDAAAFCTIEARYRHAPIDRDCCVGFRVRVASHETI